MLNLSYILKYIYPTNLTTIIRYISAPELHLYTRRNYSVFETFQFQNYVCTRLYKRIGSGKSQVEVSQLSGVVTRGGVCQMSKRATHARAYSGDTQQPFSRIDTPIDDSRHVPGFYNVIPGISIFYPISSTTRTHTKTLLFHSANTCIYQSYIENSILHNSKSIVYNTYIIYDII